MSEFICVTDAYEEEHGAERNSLETLLEAAREAS